MRHAIDFNSSRWSQYFQSRKNKPIDGLFGLTSRPNFSTEETRVIPLLYQGEKSEGGMGLALASSTNDLDYGQSLEGYAKEEYYHGVLLDKLLKYFEVKITEDNKVISLLVWLVNFGPLMFRILMLLTGEIVVIPVYRNIKKGTKDQVIRNVVTQILSDEYGHVKFHEDSVYAKYRESGILGKVLYRIGFEFGFWLFTVTLWWVFRKLFKHYDGSGFLTFINNCWNVRSATSRI